MFKNLIETFISRGLNAIGNLGIVLFTASLLGSEGRGELSIFLLNLGIISIFQNIGSGSAIAYFVNKVQLSKLYIYSLLWAILISIITSEILYFNDLSFKSHRFYLLATSIFLGLLTNNQNILLGNECLRKMNIIESLKSICVFLGLILIYFVLDVKIDIKLVFNIYLFSYIAIFIFSFFTILPFIKSEKSGFEDFNYKKVLRFGIQIQSTNFLQLINYRFIYFVVEKLQGLTILGVLSVAISIAENVWIISKSINTVLYSRLLNESNFKKKINYILFYTKISYVYTVILYSFLLFIPDTFYKIIFGETFDGINIYIISYGPAILLFSFFSQLNIYFTSNNENSINIIATALGAFCTIVLSLILIPCFGSIYACLSISVSYLFMSIYLVLKFKQKSQIKVADFFINYADIFNFKKFSNK